MLNNKITLIVLMSAAVGAVVRPGLAEGSSDDKQPKLVVQEPTFDFGTIREGDEAEAVFVLENQGQADLLVKRVMAGCGCTVVQKLTDAEKVIRPGAKLELKVTFNSKGRPGKNSKAVVVVTNDPDEPRMSLRITGTVETFFQILPNANLNITNVRRGEVIARMLDVLPTAEDRELEVVSFKIAGGALTFTSEPHVVGSRRGHRLRFRVSDQAPLGELSTRAKLKVRVGEVSETKEIIITGTVLGDFLILPTIVQGKLSRPFVRGLQLRPVKVSSVGEQPFEVFEASAGPNFETSIEPGPGRTEYTIVVRISEQAPDGPCAAFLEIRTDSPVEPLLRVPVYVNVAPRVSVEPPVVLFKPGAEAGQLSRRVVLKTANLTAFAIEGLDCSEAGLRATPVAGDEPRSGEQVIEVTATGLPSDSKTVRASVTVRTDVPGAESIRIPVVFLGAGASVGAANR